MLGPHQESRHTSLRTRDTARPARGEPNPPAETGNGALQSQQVPTLPLQEMNACCMADNLWIDSTDKPRNPLASKRRPTGGSLSARIGRFFALGYFTDAHIAEFAQSNVGLLLLVGLGMLFFSLLATGAFYKRIRSRSTMNRGSTAFCINQPGICEYNRYVKALLHDYRKTRDVQKNPSGTHTTFKPAMRTLDKCSFPVKMHYTDQRLHKWWGHVLEVQNEGLASCPVACQVVQNSSEADILVGLFQAAVHPRDKQPWQRNAVVSMEAHSLSAATLAETDILVSFHRRSDVVVNYLYGLKHGVPCEHDMEDCLFTAVERARRAEAVTHDKGMRSRRAKQMKAVMFVSNRCNRHQNFLEKLINRIMHPIGIDSYGKCFNNVKEREQYHYVGNSAEMSKELIVSNYKFHIVVENAIVEDYVTEKFFEGLKVPNLMIYLGAPNIQDYAPWPRSFVNVADFAGPEELGDYIVELDRNATEYQTYMKWRTEEEAPLHSFRKLQMQNFVRSDSESWQCRACSDFVTRFCPD